jgi:hypothetical protein
MNSLSVDKFLSGTFTEWTLKTEINNTINVAVEMETNTVFRKLQSAVACSKDTDVLMFGISLQRMRMYTIMCKHMKDKN